MNEEVCFAQMTRDEATVVPWVVGKYLTDLTVVLICTASYIAHAASAAGAQQAAIRETEQIRPFQLLRDYTYLSLKNY